MSQQEWIDRVEKRLEKLERGMAVSHWFFEQMRKQNEKILKSGKVQVQLAEVIHEGVVRWEKVLEEWTEEHPLMDVALKFSEWLDEHAKCALEAGEKMSKEIPK